MTITEFHITSLQFHMNITPCKAPLHCYLWKMTFGYGDREEVELFHSTRTHSTAALKHVDSVQFSCVWTLKILWSSKRTSAKSFWILCLCVFPPFQKVSFLC
jgi:hypothetical protein